MTAETKGRKRQAILVLVGVASFLALLLLPLRLSYKTGFENKVDSALSGEVVVLTENQLTFPTNAVPQGTPILSNDGQRILFVFSKKENSELSLWEQGFGFRTLTDSNLHPTGTPSLSSDGTRVAFLASKNSASQTQSLYVWEEGFGTQELISNAFSGKWILTFSEIGQKLVITPGAIDATYHDKNKVTGVPLLVRFESRLKNLNNNTVKSRIPFTITTLNEIDSKQTLARSHNNNAITSTITASASPAVGTRQLRLRNSSTGYDADNDGAADYLTFRRGIELPIWRSLSSGDNLGFTKQVTGRAAKLTTWRVGDNAGVPVAGDYNGDGVLDLATFTPGLHSDWTDTNGNWHIYLSKPLDIKTTRYGTEPYRYLSISWGITDMVAVPADYDGDGATDIGTFDPNNGTWHLLFSKGGFNAAKALLRDHTSGASFSWGQKGDVLVPADYNGDGKTEIAVWRQTQRTEDDSAEWRVRYLADADGKKRKNRTFFFGKTGDIPIPADYNGDGISEPAVFRPSEGNWYVRFSKDNIEKVSWFVPGAYPLTGDFDGDGSADFAFFDPGTGYRWQVLASRFRKSTKGWTQDALPSIRSFSWATPEELPLQIWLRQHQNGSLKQ